MRPASARGSPPGRLGRPTARLRHLRPSRRRRSPVVSEPARRAGPPGTEAALRVRKPVERHPTHVDPPRKSSGV